MLKFTEYQEYIWRVGFDIIYYGNLIMIHQKAFYLSQQMD